jgi:radical SAM protein with 4Fe4S-binding SPASM domain
VPDGAALLAAVDELVTVADEIGLVIDNLPSWRRRVGARNDFCASGCRDLAVDPYGRVYACAITVGDPAFVAGDLAREPLERIWRGSPALRLLRAAAARDRAECAACPVVDACGGECWVQAHYAARAAGRPAGYRAAFPYCDVVRPLLERLGARGTAAGAAAPADGAADDDGAGAPPPGTPDDVAAGECVAAGACGGQAAAGEAAYGLFDCI